MTFQNDKINFASAVHPRTLILIWGKNLIFVPFVRNLLLQDFEKKLPLQKKLVTQVHVSQKPEAWLPPSIFSHQFHACDQLTEASTDHFWSVGNLINGDCVRKSYLFKTICFTPPAKASITIFAMEEVFKKIYQL